MVQGKIFFIDGGIEDKFIRKWKVSVEKYRYVYSRYMYFDMVLYITKYEIYSIVCDYILTMFAMIESW